MDPLLFSLFWIFGWVVVIVLVWHLRALHRQKKLELIHRERVAALEKGVSPLELPSFADIPNQSFVVDALAALRLNPRWPLGVGALVVMVGIGLCVALRLSGDDYHRQIWSLGLVGVFLGAGLILHYFLTRPRG